MTEGKNSNITVQKNRIVIQPLKSTPIIIRKNNMYDVFKNRNSGELSIKNIKFGSSSTLYKEDVIFDSNKSELLWDSPMKVTIVNKFNLLTNSSRTTATCTNIQGKVSITTSDQISKVIGQKNYDTVLAALCSGHLPEKIKIQAILAVLKDTGFENRSVQTENFNFLSSKMELKEESKDDKTNIRTRADFQEEKGCQTDENCMDLLYKFKQKKRYKKSVLTPYVVTDEDIRKKTEKIKLKPDTVKRVIVDLDKKVKIETHEGLPEPNSGIQEPKSVLPELHLDETSSNSDNLSNISISCDTVALREAEDEILTSIGQRTMNINPCKINFPDGTSIMVPVKPEDDFHIATPAILNNVLPQEKKKLLWYQAYIDWSRCLERDSDGLLPLHNAVLNRDADLVRRQCIVLKTRHQSLDILADKMTALQISIVQDSLGCTAALLRHGADVLNITDDEEHRAAAHLAAEGASDQLQAVLNHCQNHARDVLMYHEDELWKPEYETKTDEELAAILLRHVCNMADSQGYTPLMIAAKMGNYTNVKILVEACPSSVNAAMPNSGNTALFLATAEAVLDAARRGNKSKVADHYHRTVTILVENGADPTVTNYAGTTVNDLLTESNNTELSLLFANVITAVNFFDGAFPSTNANKFMLVKDSNGDVKLADQNVAIMKDVRSNKNTTSGSYIIVNNDSGDVNLTDLNAKTKKEPVKRSRKGKSDGSKAHVKEKPTILTNVAVSAPKKVIVHPQSVLNGDIKLINPKDKLLKTQSPDKQIDNPGNCVTLISNVSNKTIIVKPLIKSEKVEDMTEIQTVASTSTVAAESTSQALKRKTVTYGPGNKKHKCEKADEAGEQG